MTRTGWGLLGGIPRCCNGGSACCRGPSCARSGVVPWVSLLKDSRRPEGRLAQHLFGLGGARRGSLGWRRLRGFRVEVVALLEAGEQVRGKEARRRGRVVGGRGARGGVGVVDGRGQEDRGQLWYLGGACHRGWGVVCGRAWAVSAGARGGRARGRIGDASGRFGAIGGSGRRNRVGRGDAQLARETRVVLVVWVVALAGLGARGLGPAVQIGRGGGGGCNGLCCTVGSARTASCARGRGRSGLDIHVVGIDVHGCRGRKACLRPSQRLMHGAYRHGCHRQERAQAGGDDAAGRGGGRRTACSRAVVQCAVYLEYVVLGRAAALWRAASRQVATRKATQGSSKPGLGQRVATPVQMSCPADPAASAIVLASARTNTN